MLSVIKGDNMGKTIVLNLSHINIRGDVLDVGESFGVIYNIAKDIDDEVSVDYIEEENSEVLKERSYDNCTIFFALSNIWGDSQRERLLQKISRSIKTGGSIYIWDINKEKTLYAMNGEGVAKSIIRLSEGSEIKSIRYHKDSMYILDSSIGCIYKLGNGNNLSVFNLPKIIWVFLIIFIIAIVLIIVMKFKEKKGQ